MKARRQEPDAQLNVAGIAGCACCGYEANAGGLDLLAVARNQMSAGPIGKLNRSRGGGVRMRDVQNDLLFLQPGGFEHGRAQFTLVGT